MHTEWVNIMAQSHKSNNEEVIAVNPEVVLTPEQIAEQNAKAEAAKARAEQMQNLKDSVKAEETILLVELFESHQHAIQVLDLDRKQVQTMAESAFQSVLRGKVTASVKKLKSDAFDAMRRNNPKAAEALSVEILALEQLATTI